MSYFGEELARQMEAINLNAVQLSERVEMSSSQIYSWLRGEQISLRAEQFNLIAAAMTDDEALHARLLYAHLLDEKSEALGQNLIQISLADKAELKDRPRSRSKRERALEILAKESVIDRSVAELLISLAGYVEQDPKPANSPRAVRQADTDASILGIITEKPSGDDSPPKP